MSSAQSVLTEYLLAACRADTVAIVAGVDPGKWASTAVPRVFEAGKPGLPCRGYLPCVEVAIVSPSYDGSSSNQGGVLNTVCDITVHAYGDSNAGRLLAQGIAAACAAQIMAGSNYGVLSSDVINQATVGANWHAVTMQTTVEHSYGPDFGISI